MGALGQSFPTYSDWAAAKDPSGGLLRIAEKQQQANPILMHMPDIEGLLDVGHVVGARAAVPTIARRRINQGTVPTNTREDQFIETPTLLTDRSAIDIMHPGIKSGGMAFRERKDAGHAVAFANTVATAIFYDNGKTNPDQFQGLTPRFDATSGNPYSAQIIKHTASPSGSDQASIWLLGLGEDKVGLFHPKGMQGGFQMEDTGIQYVQDGSGTANKEFRAWVTEMNWSLGVYVEDSRYVARICNIDRSALAAELAGSSITRSLIYAMDDAITAVFSTEGANFVWCMDRSIFGAFNKQLQANTVNLPEYVNVGPNNVRVRSFNGWPILVVDALNVNEAIVT